MTTAIIVHGGAGAWDLSSEKLVEAVSACQSAAALGQALLAEGRTAVDAVEAAVRILEDSPVLDAGTGSYLNAAGEVEMDAMMMDGCDLNIGAVAAVRRIKNPISLARRVMEESEHNLMVGSGAEGFADSIGFPRCAEDELLVGPELERFLALQAHEAYKTVEIFNQPGAMGDTVGAVALDKYGNLAAATSTGGTRKKLPGRVGDSPLVGSGAYADNMSAAVSATGYGEALMKIVISKRVCDLVEAGMSTNEACTSAIELLERRVSGLGGLIAIDTRGNIGFEFNTDAMPHAFATGDEPIVSGQ